MIVKRERIYIKKQGIYLNQIKRTIYLLFGFIPVFIKHEIIRQV